MRNANSQSQRGFQCIKKFFLYLSIFGEVMFCRKGKLTTHIKFESSLNLSIFEQKFLGVERAMRSVSDGELCMCTCHTNHSVGCIKE